MLRSFLLGKHTDASQIGCNGNAALLEGCRSRDLFVIGPVWRQLHSESDQFRGPLMAEGGPLGLRLLADLERNTPKRFRCRHGGSACWLFHLSMPGREILQRSVFARPKSDLVLKAGQAFRAGNDVSIGSLHLTF
jgi:hypothetical protein